MLRKQTDSLCERQANTVKYKEHLIPCTLTVRVLVEPISVINGVCSFSSRRSRTIGGSTTALWYHRQRRLLILADHLLSAAKADRHY